MSDAQLPSEILALPWATQLALSSGYAAYLMSYRGIRANHTAVDIAFSTLIFSLAATGIYKYLLPIEGIVTASLIAFSSSIAIGLLWRLIFRRIISSLLRRINVSWSDDDPSALSSVLSNSTYPISQVGVELDDGSWLYCKDASQFSAFPFGPCTFGPSGDLALYVDSKGTEEGKEVPVEHVIDERYGSLLTLVPASKWHV